MICSLDFCNKEVIAKQVCKGHYSQLRAGRPFSPIKSPSEYLKNNLCSATDCKATAKTKKLCQRHYDKERRAKKAKPKISKPTICYGPACDRKPVAKGLCNSHWAQLTRHGELRQIVTNETILQRFNKNIQEDENGCWRWIGAGSGKNYVAETGEGGYGQLRYAGKSYMAHRWSYEYYNKVTLHKEDTLDHLCRVTRCCNPEHLEIVSRSENVKRKHLYEQLRSENERMRLFITSLGYEPNVILGGDYHPDLSSL